MDEGCCITMKFGIKKSRLLVWVSPCSDLPWTPDRSKHQRRPTWMQDWAMKWQWQAMISAQWQSKSCNRIIMFDGSDGCRHWLQQDHDDKMGSGVGTSWRISKTPCSYYTSMIADQFMLPMNKLTFWMQQRITWLLSRKLLLHSITSETNSCVWPQYQKEMLLNILSESVKWIQSTS